MPDSHFTDIDRIVFIGDSITYAGGYVTRLDAALEAAKIPVEVLNLGLPSETCSGLSEPDHAGGKFPRPTIHERLARVLSATKPDLLVVAYGMNCGMYYPYSDERALLYKEGRQKIHAAATAGRTPAKVLHVTPPPFDPLPIKDRCLPEGLAEYPKPYIGYDATLEKYSQWLLSQREAAQWDVCDIRTPLTKRLVEGRVTDPNFVLAQDGVHLGSEGEWLVTRALLQHWKLPGGLAESDAEFIQKVTPETFERAKKRQALLKDAWLTTCQHLRPGMKAGLQLHEAYRQAAAHRSTAFQ